MPYDIAPVQCTLLKVHTCKNSKDPLISATGKQVLDNWLFLRELNFAFRGCIKQITMIEISKIASWDKNNLGMFLDW